MSTFTFHQQTLGLARLLRQPSFGRVKRVESVERERERDLRMRGICFYGVVFELLFSQKETSRAAGAGFPVRTSARKRGRSSGRLPLGVHNKAWAVFLHIAVCPEHPLRGEENMRVPWKKRERLKVCQTARLTTGHATGCILHARQKMRDKQIDKI